MSEIKPGMKVAFAARRNGKLVWGDVITVSARFVHIRVTGTEKRSGWKIGEHVGVTTDQVQPMVGV